MSTSHKHFCYWVGSARFARQPRITLPSPHFLLALLRFRPHIIQFFDFTPCAFFVVPFLWWLGIPVVISHHSRIDLYATYVPGFIGDYFPEVVRAACEVIFPLATGHLLIDGSQKEQSWFQAISESFLRSTLVLLRDVLGLRTSEIPSGNLT